MTCVYILVWDVRTFITFRVLQSLSATCGKSIRLQGSLSNQRMKADSLKAAAYPPRYAKGDTAMLTRFCFLIAVVFGILVLGGCESSNHSQSPNTSTACPPIKHVLESESELEARLSAAQKISNRQIRQEALEGLAASAGTAGNTKVVKKPLESEGKSTKEMELGLAM